MTEQPKKQEAQKIQDRLPSGQPVIKVLSEAPKKSDMARWNDLTLGIDINNNIGYFKYKSKFKKFTLTDY